MKEAVCAVGDSVAAGLNTPAVVTQTVLDRVVHVYRIES